jgi:hypothetical protein
MLYEWERLKIHKDFDGKEKSSRELGRLKGRLKMI